MPVCLEVLYQLSQEESGFFAEVLKHMIILESDIAKCATVDTA